MIPYAFAPSTDYNGSGQRIDGLEHERQIDLKELLEKVLASD
jgi:hypothetical protein